MPSKLELQNESSTHSVEVSLWSAEGNDQHLDAKVLSPGESTSAIVKGGVKKMTLTIPGGEVWWSGMIPVYGTDTIKIWPSPSVQRVTYRENVLVNTLKAQTSFPHRTWIWIFVIMIILAAAGWYLYARRAYRI